MPDDDNFTHVQTRPLWTDWSKYLRVGWGHRRNQLCKMFWKSVQGFRSWKTLKNGISHLNRIHRPYNSAALSRRLWSLRCLRLTGGFGKMYLCMRQLMDALCVAPSGVTQKIFAVLVEWYGVVHKWRHATLRKNYPLSHRHTLSQCSGPLQIWRHNPQPPPSSAAYSVAYRDELQTQCNFLCSDRCATVSIIISKLWYKIIIITRNMGQSPTWGRPAPQVRLEIQFTGLVGRVKKCREKSPVG